MQGSSESAVAIAENVWLLRLGDGCVELPSADVVEVVVLEVTRGVSRSAHRTRENLLAQMKYEILSTSARKATISIKFAHISAPKSELL
jgi:hypothetical protein